MREDDGHDAGVIDLEREEGALTTVDLVATDLLGVLDGDLAHGLGDGDGPGNDGEEEKDEWDDEGGAGAFLAGVDAGDHAESL